MLIDTHVHIDAPEFDPDRAAVIARAHAVGVTTLIAPAIEAAAWPGLAALAAQHPGVLPAYGLHPVYLARHHGEHLHELERWLGHAPAIAVGECGLDHFVPGLDPDAQLGYLRGQFAIARAADLPVIVHARRAVEAVIAQIKRVPGLRGVIHSYGGSAEQARQLHQLGFALGFGGPITWPGSTRLRALVASMPLDQLLLETDAPDQPLAAHRGQRNEPSRLAEVLECAAELRGVDPQALIEALNANAERLFRISAFQARPIHPQGPLKCVTC